MHAGILNTVTVFDRAGVWVLRDRLPLVVSVAVVVLEKEV
jgi:hypothetical protein